jgi:hypothetical protein
MASELARMKVAEAWANAGGGGIPDLSRFAEEFAEILDEIWSQPWLGNATTRELLNEVEARIEVDGNLDYKAVDSE